MLIKGINRHLTGYAISTHDPLSQNQNQNTALLRSTRIIKRVLDYADINAFFTSRIMGY